MKNQTTNVGLWMLAWPLFLEIFLQTLLGTMDTLMVSRISDDAVAVVGISGQLFAAMITLFTTFSSGAGILVAQRIGSGKVTEARSIAAMGVSISTVLGIAVSVTLLAFAGPVGGLLGIAPELRHLSDIYIAYVGGGLFLVGISVAMGTAIRNTGNTKGPMYTGILVNVIHIILNYGFIFGELGLPKLGLEGVAVSTLISRLVGVGLLFCLFRGAFLPRVRIKDFLRVEKKLLQDIVRIAVPLGLNSFSWMFSQVMVYSFIARMDAYALPARTYLSTLESLCSALGFAVSMGGQILTAHLYGAGRNREAYRGAYRTLYIGLVIVVANMGLIYLFGRQLLGIFTQEAKIIALGQSMLALNLLLQPAKMLNMAMGSALNAIGDARYTMITSIIVMSTVGVGGAYVSGLYFHGGLAAVYWCMLADELIRGLLVTDRWRRGKRLGIRRQQPEMLQVHGGA